MLLSQSNRLTFATLIVGALVFIPALIACQPAAENAAEQPSTSAAIDLNGKWLFEADGEIMRDPQTSGLVMQDGTLLSISDGSAMAEQRRRLHVIDPVSGVVTEKLGPMSMSSRVRRSCFSQYLSDEPDFEALVVDPEDSNVFVIVTEDATRSGALSPRCQQRFEQTGSTAYPTLLVRVVRNEQKLTMTHVRPLQYPLSFAVGDFPNDGIEGMAFGKQRELYLGLEKDAAGQPRIFSVTLDDAFWQETDFAVVKDPALLLPTFESGNHPINGMDFLELPGEHPGLLVAAARNDDQLWLVDLSNQHPTQIIDLRFFAPTLDTSGQCPEFELMDNASLEGVAVVESSIWLVNDPWKRNYMKNLVCASNQTRYEAMAPLLYELPINPVWLERYTAKTVGPDGSH